MEELKNIKLPDPKQPKSSTKKVKTEKEKKIRVVAQTNAWTKRDDIQTMTSEVEKQYERFLTKNENDPIYKIMLQQIQQKINGYRFQDIEKGVLSDDFITMERCLELLEKSRFECYYCKEKIQVLYKHVREPKQWSLERIDNKIGHTNTNVEIACLSCNLRRRTMYHERFIFTKQLNITKMG